MTGFEGSAITAIDAEARRLENWLAADKASHDQFEHSLALHRLRITTVPPGWTSNCRQPTSRSSSSSPATLKPAKPCAVDRIKLFETGDFAARANISRIENGPPVGYPVQYRVSGEDVSELRAAAEKIASAMRATPELSNVNFDWNELFKAVRIDIDQKKPDCSEYPVRTSPPRSTWP